MLARRVIKIAGCALASSALALMLNAGAAGASDTEPRPDSTERSEADTTEQTQEERLATAVEALRERAVNPVGTIPELLTWARQASLLGLESESSSFFSAAMEQATAQWQHIAQHSTNLEERLQAERQASLLGFEELAMELKEGTMALAVAKADEALRNNNDPLTLIGYMAQAEKLGMAQQAQALRAKLDVLAGGNFYAPTPGSPVAQAAQAVNGTNGGQTGGFPPAATTGGSSSSSGSSGSPAHGMQPGSNHGDPDVIWIDPPAESDSDGTSSTTDSAKPSDADRIAYTSESRSDDDHDGTTGYYTSSETYSYTGDDGKEHERTVTYDEDGQVTSVVDRVVDADDDEDSSGRCAESGCGNDDIYGSDVPTVWPGCEVDACNTGGDGPRGDDPTVDTEPVLGNGGCDPTAYHEGDCAPVEVVHVDEIDTAPAPMMCAADGCPHPDLAQPPTGEFIDEPGWHPYARPE